jgi:hypothetical protein
MNTLWNKIMQLLWMWRRSKNAKSVADDLAIMSQEIERYYHDEVKRIQEMGIRFDELHHKILSKKATIEDMMEVEKLIRSEHKRVQRVKEG